MNWIWKIISDFSDDPQLAMKNECRRLLKIAMENHNDWK
jgi:hypothetical protein